MVGVGLLEDCKAATTEVDARVWRCGLGGGGEGKIAHGRDDGGAAMLALVMGVDAVVSVSQEPCIPKALCVPQVPCVPQVTYVSQLPLYTPVSCVPQAPLCTPSTLCTPVTYVYLKYVV